MKNRSGRLVSTHHQELHGIKLRAINREVTSVTFLLNNLHSSVYSNFAKKAILPKEVTSLDRIAFFAKLLSPQTRQENGYLRHP
jgi:hypothetical protein